MSPCALDESSFNIRRVKTASGVKVNVGIPPPRLLWTKVASALAGISINGLR